MSFEVEGKLVKKYDIESKTSSFQAREFVIEIESGGYPQFVKFQLVQDRCILIDAYEEGEQIKVHFDLRGREWQGKYFTNLNAWRIEKGSTAAAPVASTGGSDASFPSAGDEPALPASADDDLPF
ncbi:MAG: DUF3127 domain-containing protein [Saprospiraceae bacterium]|nr:DUF3127 domain-containing protein [Saprospiraceae bacterium]